MGPAAACALTCCSKTGLKAGQNGCEAAIHVASPRCRYHGRAARPAGVQQHVASRRHCSTPCAAAVQQPPQAAVRDSFKDYILDLQQRIITAAEELDGSGAKFVHDRWSRDPSDSNAGFGITSGVHGAEGMGVRAFHRAHKCRRIPSTATHSASTLTPATSDAAVLEGGSVLEKAAANISVVAGVLSPERAQAMSSRGRDAIDPAGGQRYSGGPCGAVEVCCEGQPQCNAS